MWKWTCLACFCLALAASESSGGKEEWLEVNIAQGRVRGRRDSTGELFVFHEIPFATAPTGENKFKAPLPPPTWTNKYDAIDKDVKTICHQFDFGGVALPGKFKMDEQCLLTTIYVPDTKKKNLSVLVYVHGGAFQVGYGDWLKQKNLMKYDDIIVVNFNYRLGINGFLCLGTEGAPGNAGLKDQVALLRWVQKNIAAFGGNPNDVTIAGYSAGSVSVDLLMVSKSAEGLIHKVIPESGSNIAAFTTQMDPLQTAKDHAKTLNFTEVDDIDALENFYQTLPIETLFADPFLDRVDSTFLFSACVERETSEEPFLTESPENILKSGKYKKVPLLYGFANMEGLMRIDFFDKWKSRMNEKFSDFLPVDLKFETEDEKEAVAKQIKEFYFGDKPVDDENVLGYVNFFSDVLFAYSHLKAVKYHAEAGHNQVYLYEYDFVDEDTPVVPYTNIRGANHCAQSIAVSDGRNFTHLLEDDISKEFKKMKIILREIWHNFVTTGNPVPEGSSLPAWPPAGADKSPHMVLGQNIELRGVLLEERTRFWDSIYEKYYKEPIPPPEPHPKLASEDDIGGKWKKVKIEQGIVRGHRDSSGELWTFLNIPYATAPTGENKFKAPLPPPKWTEPYDAFNRNIVCPQFKHHPLMPENYVMQEDCLVANVYVPDTEKKDLSVLVYVHGGAFQIGFGDMMKMKTYMKFKDFIVISFNYRLGIHGFICLGTEDAPGNAGMKDQVALLRWVQNNIVAFGGNPNDVTIAGGSAGSASVDLLMISKSAEGLFHKVIPESGANLAAFTVQPDPLYNAKEHAKKLKFTNVDNIYALEEFYKSLSYDALTADPFIDKTDSTFIFSPCVERETGDNAFLTASPLNILKRGDYKKLPMLYGFANMEGLLRIDFFDIWKNKMNEKFSDFLPADLKFKTEAEKEEVAKQIKEFYFGDNPVGDETVLGYVDYFSDVFFVYSTLRAVKLHAEAGHKQVYLYEYSFVDGDVPVVPHTNIRGANHCAQSMAIVDGKNFTHLVEDDSSEELKRMKKTIRKFWHNFVKTGNPVPQGSSLPTWPSAGANWSPHMSLGQKVELRGALSEERTLFWNGIYEKYYKEPIPPPQPPPRKNLVASKDGEGEWKEVKIEQGIVRGHRDSSGELWTFLNVPYATAPSGENKFKAPLPPAKWTEVYDAIDKNIVCPQFEHHPFMPENYVMQENCLVANVYVPDTEKLALSVLVYVHGGAFLIGYGGSFKMRNYMKYKDFIVVTFNYRLGIHGFLCLGTEDAPGNAGMKDQVALLQWVQKNIAAFGGNPHDVTLAGGSAGSASVDLLMISKSVEGLFHRVIPESGANIAVFTIQSDPLYNAKEHAKELEFTDVDNIYALSDFYKSLSYDILNSKTFIDKTDSTFMFTPCIERETDGAFLTESPLNILKRGDYKKLPLLYGFANMEGLLRIDFFELWKNRMNEKFSDFLPADLTFETEDEKEQVAKQIKEFYFGDKPVGDDTVLSYVDYFSDVIFAYSILKAVKLHAEAGHNQVYLYEYSFVDEDTPVVPHTNVRGAFHCAQSMAIVDGKNFTHVEEEDSSEEFKRMKKTIREFWHNFVITGNPVPEGSSLAAWPAADVNCSPHMSFGQKVELRGALLEERTRFWDVIYQKYYKEPIPPSQFPPRSHIEL